MCRALGVSHASFYRWREQEPCSQQDGGLRDEIERIALAWASYGSRRIREQLQDRGWTVSRKRVQQIMREDGWLCLRQPKSWLATTDSKHNLPVFPNLAARVQLDGLDQLWVADITYIRLRKDFVFLAAILDAYSRRVIGWALDRRLETKLCLAALEKALRRRRVTAGLIHHSDRGSQYCSRAYVETLARHHIRGSMARKGNPYDNARMESFWKTLKSEQVYREEYCTLEQARRSISRFIDRIYNQHRLHSALGYRAPVEFERAIARQQAS